MPHNEYIRKQQAENMQDLKEMESFVDWSKQKEMPEQIAYLRERYGEMRLLLETSPGEMARGTILLACNVLMAGIEMIEDHYADKLGERK